MKIDESTWYIKAAAGGFCHVTADGGHWVDCFE